MSGLAPS